MKLVGADAVLVLVLVLLNAWCGNAMRAHLRQIPILI